MDDGQHGDMLLPGSPKSLEKSREIGNEKIQRWQSEAPSGTYLRSFHVWRIRSPRHPVSTATPLIPQFPTRYHGNKR